MIEFRYPTNRFLSLAFWCLRIYLICFLVGCAATRPLPVEEARELQTRTYDIEYETLFDAARTCLQDLSYTIDEVDFNAGTLVGFRETDVKLGEIATGEPLDPDEEEVPTWAWVLLIATGIIIVAGVIYVLADGDDDDDEAYHHHHHHHGGHVTEVITPVYPDLKDFYRYDVSMNLRPLVDGAAEIRVSVNGMYIEDGAVDKTGPVHDQLFYDKFFAALDSAVKFEEDRMERALERE